MLGTLPVALTTARCSSDSRLARAVLFWMMSGPPMASSIGRFSLISLGFWLICTAAWGAAQLQLKAKEPCSSPCCTKHHAGATTEVRCHAASNHLEG